MAGWAAVTRMVREGDSWSGHERNNFYLNRTAGRFSDVSGVSGVDFADDARAAATVDWDQDGRLDLWVVNRTSPRVRFLRNQADLAGFLALRLRGTRSNTDAIGARVTVVPGAGPDGTGTPLYKTLRAGEGYLAQSSKWIHFGLGDADSVTRVVVRWPGGGVESFSGLKVDRRYVLVEGVGQADPVPPAASVALARLPVDTAPIESVPTSRQARIVLAAPRPLPALPTVGFDGASGSVRDHQAGGALLINLWASWCAPCRAELEEFAANQDRFRSAQLSILALNVDADDTLAAARSFVEASGSDTKFARAPEQTRAVLDILQRSLTDLRTPMPLPSSFLIDARGDVVAVYKGTVSSETLLRDLALTKTVKDRRPAAVPFPGYWYRNPPQPGFEGLVDELVALGHPQVAGEILTRSAPSSDAHPRRKFMHDLAVAATQLKIGRVLLDDKKEGAAQAAFKTSIAAYRRALAVRPRDSKALNNLGVVLRVSGDDAAAITLFRKALPTHPNPALLHHNLFRALENLGKHDQALAELRQAVALAPDRAAWRAALAKAEQENIRK